MKRYTIFLYFILMLTNYMCKTLDVVGDIVTNIRQLETNEIKQLMVKTYEWFNYSVDPKNPLDRIHLKGMVIENFLWKSSEDIWAYNYESLCAVIQELREGDFLLTIELPFQEIIISEDHATCVLRYKAYKKYYAGSLHIEQIIAIFDITAEGKLSRIQEVSHEMSVE